MVIKIGDTITTPKGTGVVKKIENYSRMDSDHNKRYCVELENDPSSNKLVCFFKCDVK